MQEKQPLTDRLILAIAILLGAGIVIVAFVLAICPDILVKPRYTPPPSKVRIEDYSLTNYGSLITVGTHDLELTLDDEKTSGTTNQVVPVFESPLKLRNAVEVPTHDLMDLMQPNGHTSSGEFLPDGRFVTTIEGKTYIIAPDGSMSIAPITTPTHGATRPSQDR